MKRRTRQSLSAVFLMITAFAVFAGYFTLYRPLQSVLAARSWVVTDCVIQSSSITMEPSDEGGPTYRVAVRYRYEWHGKIYESERYSFSTVATQTYKSKAAIVKQLAPGTRTTCFVDPANPAEATLERGVRGNLTLGLIFGGVLLVGLTGLAWSIAGFFVKAPAPLAEPWRGRADWVAGRIKVKPTSAVTVSRILAVAFVLFGGLCAVVATKQHIPYPLGLIIWIFPAVGVGLSIWSYRNYLRWRLFRGAILELPTGPATAGGMLTGTVRLNQLTHADTGMRLRLRCYRCDSDNKEYVLWQTDQSLASGMLDHFRVAIAIPADAKPSTADGDGGWTIIWRLEVNTGNPGADCVAGFEVPVLAGAAGCQPAPAPTLGNVISAIKARIQTPPALPVATGPVALPANSRFQATTAADGRRVIIVGPFRGPANVLGWPAFTIAWTALTRLLWTLHDVPWPIRIVFTGFAVILILGTFSMLGGWSRLTAGRDGLSVVHNLFRGGRRRNIPAGDIAAFQKSFAGNAQIQEVRARLKDGRTIRLVGNIRDPLEADWLIAQLTSALGL